jgi:hypothetical protein
MTKTMRYQFVTAAAQPRIVVLTGNFRQPPALAEAALSPTGVQLSIAHRGGAATIADLTLEQWLDGVRYLAAHELIPIAELAMPGGVAFVGEVDPGRLADDFARSAAEHLATSRAIEAPENHALWSQIRKLAAQGFYVGWFASARLRGGAR